MKLGLCAAARRAEVGVSMTHTFSACAYAQLAKYALNHVLFPREWWGVFS